MTDEERHDLAKRLALAIAISKGETYLEARQRFNLSEDWGYCDSCGEMTLWSKLDAKPAFLRRWWFSWMIPARLSLWLMQQAGYMGIEFDHLECEHCYGPGWLEL